MTKDSKELKRAMLSTLFGVSGVISKSDFRAAISAIVDDLVSFKRELRMYIQGIHNGADGKDSTVPGPKGEPGKDSTVPGPKGDPGKDGVGLPGKDGSPDTGEEIIDKVNDDKSEKVIRKEKVEGLSDIEDMARSARAGVSSFSNSGSFVYDYELDSLLDGVTKTFTLPANAKVIMVLGTSFPFRFSKNTDYTYTASTITFTSQITAASTLAAGQGVTILYKLV